MSRYVVHSLTVIVGGFSGTQLQRILFRVLLLLFIWHHRPRPRNPISKWTCSTGFETFCKQVLFCWCLFFSSFQKCAQKNFKTQSSRKRRSEHFCLNIFENFIFSKENQLGCLTILTGQKELHFE